MKILLVHNYYQQAGGEDVVLAEEARLLKSKGQKVKIFSVSNDDIGPFAGAIKIGFNTSYSKGSRDALAAEIENFKPDVVHVHNFFPILTPSIYDACQDAGVPVVQTLHNFRTICAGALLLRNGKVCEKCLSATPYMGAVHGCYRGSVLASIPVARMISHHKKAGTWENKVDAFIALTEFARDKFIEGGLPGEKLYIKPNFIPDTYKETAGPKKRHGGLFVGRLSEEKGVNYLLDAWSGLDYPLKIAGSGPLMDVLMEKAGKNITFLGRITQEEVRAELRKVCFMVMPSIWYEGFSMVILEAMSMGTPIIASNLGSMQSIIGEISNKLLFEPGSSQALHERLEWAIENPDTMAALGQKGRNIYLKKYSPTKNYEALIKIYREAGAGRR